MSDHDETGCVNCATPPAGGDRPSDDPLCPEGCGASIHNYVCEPMRRTSEALPCRTCATSHPKDPCAARSEGIEIGLSIGLGIDTKDVTEGQQFYTLDELCRVRAFSLQEGLERGAAAIVGVTGMADAISRIHTIQACTLCGKAATAWVIVQGNPWSPEKVCMPCHDASRARGSQGGPYR